MTKSNIEQQKNKEQNIFCNFKENNHKFSLEIEELNKIKTKDDLNKNAKIINEMIKKINISENYRDHMNKEIENEKDVIITFVYYYKSEDKPSIKYNDGFKYILDIKGEKGINKIILEHVKNKLIARSEKEGKKSYIIEDRKMHNYYKDKLNDTDLCHLYYLKTYAKSSLIELFSKGSYFNVNDEMNKAMKEYYDKIINANDEETICKFMDIIIKIYEKRIISNNETEEKWIKSKGEFWCLISIILLLNTSIFINTQNLPNPVGNKLEFDFYINKYNLVIEIDGKQHNNKEQQYNDKIKNICCEKQNIELIRVDWNNENKLPDFLCGIYDKLQGFVSRNNRALNFDKNKFEKICNAYEKNIIICTIHHELRIEYNFDDDNEIIDNNTRNKNKKEIIIQKKYTEIENAIKNRQQNQDNDIL